MGSASPTHSSTPDSPCATLRASKTRSPWPCTAPDAVALADVSLVSELETVEALGAAAKKAGVRHRVLVMVDLGDLREGIWPEGVPAFLARASTGAGIDITGLGTNLTCFGGVRFCHTRGTAERARDI